MYFSYKFGITRTWKLSFCVQLKKKELSEVSIFSQVKVQQQTTHVN